MTVSSVVCLVSGFLSGLQSGLHSWYRLSAGFGGDGASGLNLTFFIMTSGVGGPGGAGGAGASGTIIDTSGLGGLLGGLGGK